MRGDDRRPRVHLTTIVLTVLALLVAACGTSGDAASDSTAEPAGAALGSPENAADPLANRGACSVVSLGSSGFVPGEIDPALTAAKMPDPADPEFIKEYVHLLAKGILAASQGEEEFVGWAIDELFGTDGEPDDGTSKALDDLANKLDKISAQLISIQAQLAEITNLIKDSTYISAIKSLTENHIAPILSMWQQYCEIVQAKDTDQATLGRLTDEILNSSTGIRPHVTAITLTLKGSSLTGDVPLAGMFAEFAKNQGRFSEFDDQPSYKDTIDPYTQYFVDLVVMGVTLMTEAWHQKGDVKAAQATLGDMWGDIRTIYQAGGYPVSDDKVVTQLSTAKAWTRDSLCVTAAFPSTEASANLRTSDPAQKALAYSSLFANQKDQAVALAQEAGATPPPGLADAPQLDAQNPTYTFKTGDRVCSFLWYVYTPEPRTFIPELTTASGLPTDRLSTSTDATKPVWRSPTEDDYTAVIAGRGSANVPDYLKKAGFVVPGTGVGAVNVLAYGFDEGGTSGYFDAAMGTNHCLFYASCTGGQFLGFHVVADVTCALGSGSYKGIGSACGTAWLDQRWPADPPPPGS